MPRSDNGGPGPRPVGLLHSRGLRWGVAVAVLLGGSLIVMFGLMYWRSSALLFDTLDRSVREQLVLLTARPPDMLAFMIASRMNHRPAVVTQVGLFDADLRPIVGDVAQIPAGLPRDGKVHPVLAPGQPPVHWRAAGRTLADGRILIVARDAEEVLAVRAGLVHGAVIGIVPAILLSLGVGAWAGIATEQRLRRLNAIAERIIAGDLGERLPQRDNGDELDRLCAIVNRILGRLEEGVDALKGVGENIAHDLRTPLTAMRARLERALRLAGPETPLGAIIGQSIESADRALSIVTALLRISDIQHVRRESAFAEFDLAQIVRETAESYQPVAEEKFVDLSFDIVAPAAIVGDRQLLIEALVNLVDNAVKFTPRGGQVRIVLGGTPGRPVITVSDTGPGISPQALSAVFQRFYRADTSRTTPGSGLGLSMVAAIIRLHRFSITIRDSEPGCCMDILCWPGAAA